MSSRASASFEVREYGALSSLDRVNRLTNGLDRQAESITNLNTRFKQQAYWQGNLRERTIGLRREVSKVRNDLLLLAFSLGVVQTTILDAIKDSERYKNSLLGLNSIARTTGNTFGIVKDQALSLTQDGLLNLADASAALKNLMASKFDLPQAIQIMRTFKDAAAFNRQGTLEFGNAVVRATEGIKNQISALVDNVGITKNLSVIMKEAGFQMEDLQDEFKGTAARAALLNGLMKEGSLFMGDAARAANTYSGAQSRLKNLLFETRAEFGKLLTGTAQLPGIFSKLTLKMEGNAKLAKEFVLQYKDLINLKLNDFFANLGLVINHFGMLVNALTGGSALRLLSNFIQFFATSDIGLILIQFKLFSKIIRTMAPYTKTLTSYFTNFIKTVQNSKGSFAALSADMRQFMQNSSFAGRDFLAGFDTKFQATIDKMSTLKTETKGLGIEFLKLRERLITSTTDFKKVANEIGLDSAKNLQRFSILIRGQRANIAKVTDALNTLKAKYNNLSDVERKLPKFTGLRKEIDMLEKQLTSLKKSAGAAIKTLNTKLNKEIFSSSYGERLSSINAGYKNQREILRDLTTVQDIMTSSAQHTVRGYNRMEESLIRLKEAGVISKEELANMQDQLGKLRNTARVSDAKFIQFGGTIDKLGKKSVPGFINKLKFLRNKVVDVGVSFKRNAAQGFKSFITGLRSSEIQLKLFNGVLALTKGALLGVANILGSMLLFAVVDKILSWVNSVDNLRMAVTELNREYSDLSDTLKQTNTDFRVAQGHYDDLFNKVREAALVYGATNNKVEEFDSVVKQAGKISASTARRIKDLLASFDPTNIDAFNKKLLELKKALTDEFSVNLEAPIIEAKEKLKSITADSDLFDGKTVFDSEQFKEAKELSDKILLNRKLAVKFGSEAARWERKSKQEVRETTELYAKRRSITNQKELKEINDKINTQVQIMRYREAQILDLRKRQQKASKIANTALKEQAELLESMGESQRDYVKQAISVEQNLERISKNMSGINKDNINIDNKGVFRKGIFNETSNSLADSLYSIDELVKKISKLDDKKKIKVDFIKPDTDFFTTEGAFKSIDVFISKLKEKFKGTKGSIRFYSKDGIRSDFENLDELVRTVKFTGKILKGTFSASSLIKSGTVGDIRNFLLRLKRDLDSDTYAKLVANIDFKVRKPKKAIDKIDAIIAQLQRRVAKAKAPDTTIFGGLNDELAVFKVRVLQAIKADKKLGSIKEAENRFNSILKAAKEGSKSLVGYSAKVKKFIEEFNKFKNAQFDKMLRKLTVETEKQIKSMELQISSVQLVSMAYKDLNSTQVDYYQEIGARALDLARIQDTTAKSIFDANRRIEELQKRKKDPNNFGEIERIDLQIAKQRELINTLKDLGEVKQKVLLGDIQGSIVETLRNLRNEAISTQPFSVVESIFGINPSKAKQEIDYLETELSIRIQELKNRLNTQLEAKTLVRENFVEKLLSGIDLTKIDDIINKISQSNQISDKFKESLLSVFQGKNLDPSELKNKIQQIIDKQKEADRISNESVLNSANLDKEKIMYNARLELARSFVKNLEELGTKLLDMTLFNFNKETLALKAKADAEQTILRRDYQERKISKKDYELQSQKLAQKTALEERIAYKRKLIAEKEFISNRLKAKAIEWGIEALALSVVNPAAAATLAAAAAVAGGAAIAIGKRAAVDTANLERDQRLSQDRIERYRGFGKGQQVSEPGQARVSTVGGTITAQQLNITIAPSVVIQGDTVLLGSMGVTELEQTIGQASVNAVKQAIETKEINVADLENGNVGG